MPAHGDESRNGMSVGNGSKPSAVVCEDHGIVREIVVSGLVSSGRFGEVEATGTTGELLEAVERVGPEVVVVDIELPDEDGLIATSRVLEVSPGTKVVVLSGHVDPELVEEARLRGAAGFVSKAGREPELLEAIDEALDGGAPFPDLDPPSGALGRLLTLSPREREILDLVADGMKAEEIGVELGIGTATVYTHVRNTIAKLRVRTRGEAVALAVRYSYLGPRVG